VTPAPTVRLVNGVDMPTLGLGTWPMDNTEAARAVRVALDLGYRLIDTAENYANETGVGEAVRSSGLPRDEVFLTTKFNRKWHSIAGVREACEASLRRLGLDYIDLFLIHWPNPEQDRYVEAFEGLLRVQDEGLVRAVGVSNFKPTHLQKLFDRGFTPHVNQVELNPRCLRSDLVDLHRERGIISESWSPIGRGGDLLDEPPIVAAAQRTGRTSAQIVLRWHVQSGYTPIPKSSDSDRQAENLAIFDFALTDAEMSAISALNSPDASGIDSDKFGH